MTSKCSAHFVPEEDESDDFDNENQIVSKKKESNKLQTLYVIKFDSEVTRRDSQSGE